MSSVQIERKQNLREQMLEVGRAAGTIQLDETAKATTLTLVLPAEIAKALKPAGDAGDAGAANTVEFLGMEVSETAVAVGGTVVVLAGLGVGAGLIIAEEQNQSERAEDRRDANRATASPSAP